ncbi:lipoprotein-releasing ABC transporter permease subunit [Lichenifustis flavocetrariae]|uniref:Lipoprotein-releasing ABC transporter permease subunit n=1 Tax=Lichenifustis flavocetrariae TaxID=2949735 RepID=A0AA42CHV5_9HYPH|nr:lipoprotein-releasing ABC transporter permease subunit [Lichenifustis flavocetrariae]MCW6507938.1 lipoprotein-releasing ABC transporter permease subunit [Lichenifustis flavocetrariae]
MVALRYLRARRERSFISVIAAFSFLGIMLGVATLIVVMSVMNGFRAELLDKIVGINGHIFLQGVETPLTDFDAVDDRVAKVPGVKLVIPMIEGAAGVSSQYNQAGALIRGIRENDLKRLPGIVGHITLGSLDGFDQGGGLAIGQRLAEALSLRIGDTISVLTAKGAQTPFGVAPRIKSYPVAAIFNIGMSEFDSSFVYMPLTEAQSYFGKEGEATVVEVFVDHPDRMDQVRKDIDGVLGRPMIMTDWRQRNKTFFDALQVERNVMFVILTLIVLVAALNIVSGLIMLVKDKGPDIAILRTMGATRGAILRIFLMTGASIGIAGTLAGLILGLLVAHNIESIRSGLNWLLGTNLFPSELYFLSRLPSVVEPGDVLAVTLLTLALSLLATIYPSWRAATLDPVEALRYE